MARSHIDSGSGTSSVFHETKFGQIINGNSLDVLADYPDQSVNLIVTSPPFGLVRKKD